jgi:hypothetical protein
MGPEESLTSRALPRLLATLLLTACGGKYSKVIETEGASGSTSTSGTGAVQGGSSSASGGAAAGTGMSLTGGSVGIGGTPSGGTGAGHEVLADAKSCDFYCSAYAMSCAEAALPQMCREDCNTHLGGEDASCRSAKRGLFVCVAQALAEHPMSCSKAFATADVRCELAQQELGSCSDIPCQTTISGDATGCRAVMTCTDGSRSLYCRETGTGSTPCSCTVNGNPTFDVLTNFASSKQACSDEMLMSECRDSPDPGL